MPKLKWMIEMKSCSYLIFGLKKHRYYIDINYVEDILPLPKFTTNMECVGDVITAISFRGCTCPILDLNFDFDCQTTEFSPTDSLLIINWQQLRAGLVANTLYEVDSVPTALISSETSHDREFIRFSQKGITISLIEGVDDSIILSHPGELVQYALAQWLPLNLTLPKNQVEASQVVDAQFPLVETLLIQEQYPISTVTSEESNILLNEIDTLQQLQAEQKLEPIPQLTIFRLQHYYFGVDLKLVREFTDTFKIMPIPCCPLHIVGNMNLRGEVLTLIDISQFVNLPQTPSTIKHKVVVIEVEDIIVGIVVDEVYDVMFSPDSHNIMPAALIQSEFLQKTVSNEGETIHILDLSKMLLSDQLIVNEIV